MSQNPAVEHSDSTRWSLISGAAKGERAARGEFARRYEPVVRAYLGARWRSTPHRREIDDAAQEVFLDCFRDDGALGRVDPERSGGFRPFLYGVTRNVARRVEERVRNRRERQPGSEFDLEDLLPSEDRLSQIFDRAWANSLLAQAGELHRIRARENGPGERRSVEAECARILECFEE